ncbi:hypothetical protein H5407_10285 [Mitsuaria sp. WAJ17]|uniref:hypothetical protein n=1 Tax=Mitsuaria sp. WAJ17 TaxID=2761452 RepID=UPI0016039B89|nr:hypothetical protein [Mitsuaria sp. WAJ17]MBB2485610.1 hypothetical protein [Mitsuaria sp. WAJ17]
MDRRQVLALLAVPAGPLPALAQDLTPARPLPFRLRSRFWMNLHHVLAELVQTDSGLADWRQPHRWPDAEGQAWQAAQHRYREAFAEADIPFDERFQALRLALLGVADGQPLPTLEPALRPFGHALEQAAGPYRRHLWSRHAALNEAWIHQAQPLLGSHGQRLRERLEAVLQPAMPEFLPVDVVACAANFAGAYTHPGPAHTIMPSTRKSYQGDASLEMLFHEACHTGMDSRLIRDINALLAPRGLTDKRGLWHATQFFTVGHLTQRLLAEAGRTYEPYAQRWRVLERAWGFAVTPLATHWQPYLEGRRSRDEALAALVFASYPA